MKFRAIWLPLMAAAALAVPGPARAQEDDEPRPGMIGVMFDDSDSDDGVRVIEVRRGSPADRAGLEAGDVVIRLNGRDAGDEFEGLPGRLQAGDSVRMRIRRRDGGERDVVVVAVPRPQTRVDVMRPGRGENVIIINGDSMRIPLEAITMRIDSLQTRLQHLDGARVRVQMDSLVHLFRDSAQVFIERMPNVEFRIAGPEFERRHLEQGLEALEGAAAELHREVFEIDEERPFFLELGRRAAAGAELAEMNEGLSRYFDNVRGGALVIDVSEDTPAARAGLEAGDVIVRAGGRDVNDPEDVRRALTRAENGRVALEVVRQGRRRELTLEWDGHERVIRRELAPTRVRVNELAPTRERTRVRGRVVPPVAPTPEN